jgi:hypothetical protein
LLEQVEVVVEQHLALGVEVIHLVDLVEVVVHLQLIQVVTLLL